ncbi:MAG: flagellar motor switch protein FliN [Desulfobacteraceae bacterium]|nr:flagellar motor switch protein FliN [Desulfobacteraceae bacterium]
MLSQEELDKLLAQGHEGAQGPKAETIQEETKKAESAGLETTKTQEGAGDLNWSAAFEEAAAGGDAAAAKAVKDGTASKPERPADSQDKNAQRPKFDEFSPRPSEQPGGINKPDLDFILEIPLEISVELGRTRMQIRDLLQLGQGSIITLDKLAGEPADIYVNQRLMAKGDVVVVNEKFGIKLNEILNPADRVKKLGSQKY